MTPLFLALFTLGVLLLGVALLTPVIVQRVSPRLHRFIACIVSAFFGACLFALLTRILGWSALRTTTEIAAFAVGILVFSFITGWAGTRFASHRSGGNKA